MFIPEVTKSMKYLCCEDRLKRLNLMHLDKDRENRSDYWIDAIFSQVQIVDRASNTKLVPISYTE